MQPSTISIVSVVAPLTARWVSIISRRRARAVASGVLSTRARSCRHLPRPWSLRCCHLGPGNRHRWWPRTGSRRRYRSSRRSWRPRHTRGSPPSRRLGRRPYRRRRRSPGGWRNRTSGRPRTRRLPSQDRRRQLRCPGRSSWGSDIFRRRRRKFWRHRAASCCFRKIGLPRASPDSVPN